MIKKNIFYLFYISWACLWPLGAGAAWKKNRSRSRLWEKSGAGAARKKNQEPEKKIIRLLSPAYKEKEGEIMVGKGIKKKKTSKNLLHWNKCVRFN